MNSVCVARTWHNALRKYVLVGVLPPMLCIISKLDNFYYEYLDLLIKILKKLAFLPINIRL